MTPNQSKRSYGQKTDTGLLRPINQDSILVRHYSDESGEERPGFDLFVVADGMGGHEQGERASAMATDVISREFAQSLKDSSMPIIEALVNALETANRAILEEIPRSGTVVTAAVLVGRKAHIVHVGDTRAYLIAGDSIEQLTHDHSLVQRLIDMGQHEQAEHYPPNILYRALGQFELLEVDTFTRQLPAGGRLLLCSDGLWGVLKPEEIQRIANNTDLSPDDACAQLVNLANERGGPDNIAAILVDID
ncbi:MAG: serine/threonine-protein phosphatase [Anaerolineaceae bacterium]|nr:serine/threonine-protein phosphatase [Anaerolineaceae bacterium]